MGTLYMSQKEVSRFDVINRLIRKEINGPKAAQLLNLSTRQVRTLKKKVKNNGPKGLLHGNRGKPSNRKLPEKVRTEIVSLLHKKYPDFGPTFAAEKLREDHMIDYDPKTIRGIQIEEGLWKPRRGTKRDEHREWRKRKDCYGEMLQFDGSYHDWLEGRWTSNEQCLLAAIDDATGRVVSAHFAEHEGVLPVMGFWKEYMLSYRKPRSIYLDKFSTYKVNHQIARENPDVKTQFQRACNQLGIELIFANSPQAKGRIERLFDTLQDRLVKELRLVGISNPADANRFLEGYLPKFNTQFAVDTVSNTNLHQPLTAEEKKNLDSILSRHTPRTVQNDFTLSFNNQWYQIMPTKSVAVRKKDKVTVEEHMDSTIHVRLRGKELSYKLLPQRPRRMEHTKPVWVLAGELERTPYKPAANHPWRRPFLAKEIQRNALSLTDN